MRALKIKVYQETVCYKKPYAFKVAETYPLPAYSTVIGMLHRILKAESGEYYKMDISIQGNYESIISTYNTTRFYKKNVITSRPLNTHLLYGVNLILHIVADNDVLDNLYNGFKEADSAFTLGRNEDLARIDDIRFVNLQRFDIDEEDDDEIILNNCMYIPDSYNMNLNGIRYKINKVYNVINNLREWEKVRVTYVESGSVLEEGTYYKDNEMDIAFLA